MLAPGDRILAGVSGGADSVCLLLILCELGHNVAVAHVNHGLRAMAADEDESFTAALAQRLGLNFFARRVVLIGGNTEASGRDARRDFFNELAAEHGFTKVALAHTLNDRVETLLFNLFRGAGAAGLASMAPVAGTTIRPLIETSRGEIEAYLQTANQPWRTDVSNFNLDFARNRLRHAVIPQLAAAFNPNLVETLGRCAEILASEEDWMRTFSEVWLNEHGTREGDRLVLSVGPVASAHVALVRRVLRAALSRCGSTLRDVSFDQIEAVRGLLEPGKSGKAVEIPGGMEVAREFDRLVFRRKAIPESAYDYELQIPGSVFIPEVGKLFRADFVALEGPEVPGRRVFVDADSIGPYVRIRNWKPGDYYKPVGLPAGKLKKLFQRARIPRSHRRSWPVVVADSTIIWVASFPVSREFAPRGRSQKIVAIEALQI
jgi:tRNA(Ile)-lysidine synthase